MPYFDSLDEARSALDRARNEISALKPIVYRLESDISDCKAEIRSFKDRLDEVESIIKFFDNDVTNSIKRENTSARYAGEKYAGGICCDSITGANMEHAFHSMGIDEDGAMLNPAYQDCVNEKHNIETSIDNLRDEITRLNNVISGYEGDIRHWEWYEGQAEDDIRYYHWTGLI